MGLALDKAISAHFYSAGITNFLCIDNYFEWRIGYMFFPVQHTC